MTVVITHSTPSDSSFSASGAVAWDASHTLAGVGTMAGQNANTVAITGGAIDGTTVGGTAPAAGTFTTLIGGGDAANYGQLTGGATTKAVQFRTLGTDTNISVALQPKGTGAIDLAAGSSGVNISNGSTVTAVTRTATGSAYTSLPSLVISAPTTAGGVQAVASVIMAIQVGSVTIVSGGTGYTAGDVLTVVGGTGSAGQIIVGTVSSGVITAATRSNSLFGQYTVLPTSPVSVTGGTGSGATFNLLYEYFPSTITNAGSGYVEQPTVTFSGGGGSGAAAYATVGSATIIRSLGGGAGQSLSLYTPGGESVRIQDGGASLVNVVLAAGAGTGGIPYVRSAGSDTNVDFYLGTKGTGAVRFLTNALAQEQFRVAHTASAVNYVQVTGGATGGAPVINAQGSDANIALILRSKGTYACEFQSFAGNILFQSLTVTSSVNYLRISPAITNASPIVSAQGTDTDIDLALTPKGAGNVRFGTYTGTILTPTGYVEIKDSGGTVRRLLVG
jgi:hypothetical protein